jgi:hypothetical protein
VASFHGAETVEGEAERLFQLTQCLLRLELGIKPRKKTHAQFKSCAIYLHGIGASGLERSLQCIEVLALRPHERFTVAQLFLSGQLQLERAIDFRNDFSLER